MGPETAPFRPRGQKTRDHSVGINPYSHSSEYRSVPCYLETRGVNGEIAGEREQNGQEKASVPTRGRRLDYRIHSLPSLAALPRLSYETKLISTARHLKVQVRTLSTYSHSSTLVCRGVIPVAPSFRRRHGRVPSNGAMSRFVGLGGKSRDNFKNSFQTQGLEFSFFVPKGVADSLRKLCSADNARFETQPPCNLQAASCNRKRINAGGLCAVRKIAGHKIQLLVAKRNRVGWLSHEFFRDRRGNQCAVRFYPS